jgi:hypothetical protein
VVFWDLFGVYFGLSGGLESDFRYAAIFTAGEPDEDEDAGTVEGNGR